MTCKYCKGTGKLELFTSIVDCDCVGEVVVEHPPLPDGHVMVNIINWLRFDAISMLGRAPHGERPLVCVNSLDYTRFATYHKSVYDNRWCPFGCHSAVWSRDFEIIS